MEFGEMVMTNTVYQATLESAEFDFFVYDSLRRYMQQDWGDTCDEDSLMNDHAVKTGEDRIVALYKNEAHGNIFIITEWDRSYTTVLFCDEY